MKKIFGFSLICFAFLLASCNKDDDTTTTTTTTEECITTGVTYTNDIASILNTSCALSGCHTADQAMTTGSLEGYTSAVAFVGFGRIMGALNHEADFSPMPYPPGSDMLPQCDIDKIEAWIAAGTPE